MSELRGNATIEQMICNITMPSTKAEYLKCDCSTLFTVCTLNTKAEYEKRPEINGKLAVHITLVI